MRDPFDNDPIEHACENLYGRTLATSQAINQQTGIDKQFSTIFGPCVFSPPHNHFLACCGIQSCKGPRDYNLNNEFKNEEIMEFQDFDVLCHEIGIL